MTVDTIYAKYENSPEHKEALESLIDTLLSLRSAERYINSEEDAQEVQALANDRQRDLDRLSELGVTSEELDYLRTK